MFVPKGCRDPIYSIFIVVSNTQFNLGQHVNKYYRHSQIDTVQILMTLHNVYIMHYGLWCITPHIYNISALSKRPVLLVEEDH
jgi:hypothetical protein